VPDSDENGAPYATIGFKVSDGAAVSASAYTLTVNVTAVNDPPSLTATALSPTYTENGSASDLFSTVTAATVDSGQTITSLTLTVGGLANGANEILGVDGTDVALTNGNSVTTATNGMTASVTVSSGTATVTISKVAGISTSATQTLVDGLSYRVNGDTPTAGNRVVTLTSIKDNGGTANGGADTTSLNIASTVTVVAVNDAPLFSVGQSAATTAVGSGEDVATSMVVQPDGKVIVAGYSTVSGNYDFSLIRYNADGTIDTSFGTSGKVFTAIDTGNDQAYSVALQSDGKIVVAGSALVSGHSNFAIARYNANGTLDTSFGSGGKATLLIGSNSSTATSVVVQTDGKIVVGGYADGGGGNQNDFALARFTSTGVLDTTFGSGVGYVTTQIGSNTNDFLYGIALQTDGKIVAAGKNDDSTGAPGVHGSYAVARYNTDGSLDTNFGNSGKVAFHTGDNQSGAYAVAVQSDGMIVLAGARLDYSFTGGFNLVRLTTTGSIDSSFPSGSPAQVLTNIDGTTALDEAHAVLVQSDGKIVAAGFSASNFAAAATIPTARSIPRSATAARSNPLSVRQRKAPP
jgi:uncharacterized delta-60 repeat protein